MRPSPRLLVRDSVAAASALLGEAIAGSPYHAAGALVLRAAADAPGPEARGLVVDRGGSMVGVIVYGEFAGAQGAGRLHLVAVAPMCRGQGVGSALMRAAMCDLRDGGARFLLAEVPDDPAVLGDYWAFLAARGFREESRVSDLCRDGVALVFLRRDFVDRSGADR